MKSKAKKAAKGLTIQEKAKWIFEVTEELDPWRMREKPPAHLIAKVHAVYAALQNPEVRFVMEATEHDAEIAKAMPYELGRRRNGPATDAEIARLLKQGWQYHTWSGDGAIRRTGKPVPKMLIIEKQEILELEGQALIDTARRVLKIGRPQPKPAEASPAKKKSTKRLVPSTTVGRRAPVEKAPARAATPSKVVSSAGLHLGKSAPRPSEEIDRTPTHGDDADRVPIAQLKGNGSLEKPFAPRDLGLKPEDVQNSVATLLGMYRSAPALVKPTAGDLKNKRCAVVSKQPRNGHVILGIEPVVKPDRFKGDRRDQYQDGDDTFGLDLEGPDGRSVILAGEAQRVYVEA